MYLAHQKQGYKCVRMASNSIFIIEGHCPLRHLGGGVVLALRDSASLFGAPPPLGTCKRSCVIRYTAQIDTPPPLHDPFPVSTPKPKSDILINVLGFPILNYLNFSVYVQRSLHFFYIVF